jgi:hypothetical protein
MGHKNRKIKPSQPLPQNGLLERPPGQLHTPASISFRYFAPGDNHCLSHCIRDEVRHSTDCMRKLTTMGWQQVLQSGGKGEHKAGLAYTEYSDSDLKGVSRPPALSRDIKIAAVRVSQGMRMFGGYHQHVFYVLWFDRNHAIVPYRKNR